MPDLFKEGFEPQTPESWKILIDGSLPDGVSSASLIWEPERLLRVDPFQTSRPPGHSFEPMARAPTHAIICDTITGLPAESVAAAVSQAVQQGISGFELRYRQFQSLHASSPGAGILTDAELNYFIRCGAESEWRSLLGIARSGPESGVAGTLQPLFDPFQRSDGEQAGQSTRALDEMVRFGLDSQTDRLGSTWSINATANYLSRSSCVTRIGYVLSAVSALFQRIAHHGLPDTDPASLLRIVWPVGSQFILEIAAIRAIRLLTPQVLESIFGETRQIVPVPLHINNEVLASAEMPRDPAPRNTAAGSILPGDMALPSLLMMASLQAMVAMVTGCESLALQTHGRSPDSDTASKHRRWLRNIALILEHEAKITSTADPLAGSYVVEELTDQIARKSWRLFMEIESAGGIESEPGWCLLKKECAMDNTRESIVEVGSDSRAASGSEVSDE